MKQSVLTLILFALSYLAFGRGDINYEHKAIQKTLVKSCNMVNPQLSEVTLPKELCCNLQGKFFSVTSDTDSDIKHMYIGRVNSCRAGGCSIPTALTQGGDSEYFDYLVLFNAQNDVVLVKVFNYQATHGHEVTAKGWLKQFIGYNTSDKDLEVGKNIDSISGATISVNSITQDISDKTRIINEYLSRS